jgi:hypothetical protein
MTTDICAKLRENAEGLKEYMDSFYEAKREQHDSMFGRPYGLEERVADLLPLVQRLAVSIYQGLNETAGAIETLKSQGAPSDDD